MRFSRRQVSALLVLLALVAAACGSDPVDLVSGDDGEAAEQDAVGDDAETDADPEQSDNPTSSVADDSAPVVTGLSVHQQEMLGALDEARATWSRNGSKNHDFTLFSASTGPAEDRPPSPHYQIEVRQGEVSRVVPEDGFRSELDDFNVADLLEELDSAIQDDDGFQVDFDAEFGIPEHIRWSDDGVELVLLIENFRVAGDYPEKCSTSGLVVEVSPIDGAGAVNSTRSTLLAALASCDFLTLSHLASLGREPLTTSFGGSGVERLWEAESSGEPLMTTLYELLAQDPATKNGVTVWPAEFANENSEYLDWRVGIAEDGEWLFFVAGD